MYNVMLQASGGGAVGVVMKPYTFPSTSCVCACAFVHVCAFVCVCHGVCVSWCVCVCVCVCARAHVCVRWWWWGGHGNYTL